MSTVLVTGAAAGLGRAIAIEAGRRGHQLRLVDVSPAVEQVAARLAGARALVADLAAPDAVDRIAAWAPDADVVINNAGIALKGEFHELPVDRLQLLVDVNIRAPLLLSRIYLERFVARRGGMIVNVSSSATHFPTPGLGPYGASKAFLTAMSETLESEARAHRGVKILCLCPAGMATSFQATHGVRNEDSKLLMDPAIVARWCLDDIEKGRTGVRDYGLSAHAMRALRRVMPRRALVRILGGLVSSRR